ncbi:MAG: hypothetical protein M3R17_01805 [Bacteroidota bacterium]|nr:hypothetical protein [Bacteroidota bacterium]
MKHFLICLSILFFASCNVEQKPSAIPESQEIFCSGADKNKLLQIIEGGWVNEEYIKMFLRLRSPMAVAAKEIALQQLAFDISNLSGDTLINAIGKLNCNEGERFDVIFYTGKNGKTKMKLVEDRDDLSNALELDYEIAEGDTILVVKKGSAPSARFKRQFRIIFSANDIPVSAMEYYVNKHLFAGEWEMNGAAISFTEKGSARNFKSFRHYSVTTRDPEAASLPDEISFYNDTSGITYAFTVRNNTIQLYELKQSEDGTAFSRGPLFGELKRR